MKRDNIPVLAAIMIIAGIIDYLVILGLWEWFLGATPRIGWILYFAIPATAGAITITYLVWAFQRNEAGRWKHKWGLW